VRGRRLLLSAALIILPAVLNSCGKGATSTTATPTITVSCSPTSVTVLGTSLCTATVTNETSTLVNWSVSGTGSGSITSGGQYTAPATVPTTNNGVVTITATSQVLSTLTATQGITIQAATAIAAVTCLDPTSSSNLNATTVSSGNTLNCTATASTGAVVPVTWTVTNSNNLGGNVGTITPQGGNYVAPLLPPPGQSVTITATTANALSTMNVKVSVIFGNKVLNGNYAFSTSGRLTNASNAFWARVGRFSAGGGTLLGIEDTNQGGTPNVVNTQIIFSGFYSIDADGRGKMQFCEGISSGCDPSSVTSNFRIVVVSPGEAKIIEFSSPSTAATTTTAGGEIVLQAPLVVPNNGNLSGTYSFNFSGVSGSATEQSVVGEFTANGFGTINAGSASPPAPGELDIDAGGAVPLASTAYTISSNGRGTVTLNGLTFSFYPVSAGRVKFIEIDTPVAPATTASILVGDAYKQQTTLTCGWGLGTLSGLTVLQTSGESSGVAIADLGSFTANNGVVAAGWSLDENSGGTYTPPSATPAGSYTMDPCGRGTLALDATHSYVFYIISPSNAVIQQINSGVVAHGFLNPSQGGPFVDSTFTGSYAFRIGGTDAAASAGKREDFSGQLNSSGSGTGLAGTLDLNDFGATQSDVAITNGTYLPSPAGTLRATVTLPVATTPASTRNFVMYMVSPTLFYVLETDPAGMATGVLNTQF
jgi:hypothetical protein